MSSRDSSRSMNVQRERKQDLDSLLILRRKERKIRILLVLRRFLLGFARARHVFFHNDFKALKRTGGEDESVIFQKHSITCDGMESAEVAVETVDLITLLQSVAMFPPPVSLEPYSCGAALNFVVTKCIGSLDMYFSDTCFYFFEKLRPRGEIPPPSTRFN